jgi:hypothetical protein
VIWLAVAAGVGVVAFIVIADVLIDRAVFKDDSDAR